MHIYILLSLLGWRTSLLIFQCFWRFACIFRRRKNITLASRHKIWKITSFLSNPSKILSAWQYMKPFSSSNKDPTSTDKKIISLTLLNFNPEVHMQPTLPPRLHIKLESSKDTSLDQAPELSTLPLYRSYYIFAKNNLYFVYLILIFVLNYFLF